jgi:hypothetical protein
MIVEPATKTTNEKHFTTRLRWIGKAADLGGMRAVSFARNGRAVVHAARKLNSVPAGSERKF